MWLKRLLKHSEYPDYGPSQSGGAGPGMVPGNKTFPSQGDGLFGTDTVTTEDVQRRYKRRARRRRKWLSLRDQQHD